MAEDKEERRKRVRDASSCENSPPALRKDVLPEGRPTFSCDVPVAPSADPFEPPAPCPPIVTPNTVIPDPLEIANAEFTEECPAASPKNGPEGTAVTVEAAEYISNFFFTSITGVTNNQLTFISTITDPERAELIDAATTVNRIVEITGLSSAQATELKNGVATLQSEVDAIAAEAAYAQIICFWENVEQEVECANGALTDDDVLSLPAAQQPFVNNPSTIAAASFTSTISQNDANAIALSAANDALLCLFGNAEITRTCEDLGFTETISDVDAVADTLDGQVRKGSATVAENTVFSTTSILAANIAAEAIADSQLNCFYINPEVVVTCAGEGLVAGSPGTNGPPVGNALTGARGQIITVPAGFLTSSISTADAENKARDYGVSLLECWICNTAVSLTCEAQIYIDKDGDALYKDPSPLSSPSSVNIPACFIRSEESLSDANVQAQAAANAQLNCIYCNPVIPPTCVPAGFENPPVPLDAYNRATWSRDATAGQAADVYCCQGAGAAQNCYEIGDGVGSIPIDSRVNEADCRYGNDEQQKNCGGDTYVGSVLTELRGGGSASIPADVFFVGESAGGKAQANQLAQDLLDASLQCFWYNFAQTGSCPSNTFSELIVTQAERTVQSFSSQEDANELALTLAITRSRCSPRALFGNSAVSCDCTCAEGEVLLSCPEVPANAVRSHDQGEADAAAGALACSLVVCGPEGGDGLPGNDGAQTGCGGTCYGYYS